MAEVREIEIGLAVEKVDDREAWRKAVARSLKVAPARVAELRLLKKSIDARKAPVRFRLRFEVGLDGPLPVVEEIVADFTRLAEEAGRVVIVGCGPAGMFAALRCIELGWKPVVLDSDSQQVVG